MVLFTGSSIDTVGLDSGEDRSAGRVEGLLAAVCDRSEVATWLGQLGVRGSGLRIFRIGTGLSALASGFPGDAGSSQGLQLAARPMPPLHEAFQEPFS